MSLAGDDAASDGVVEALAILGEHLINTILEGGSEETIKEIIDQGAPVWYQNDSEGLSPLHAAVYMQNQSLAKMFLEEGAVWNAVDHLNNTAGDIALSFNSQELYTIIRDAGIRAEMLLALLASRATSELPSNLVLRNTDVSAAASTDMFLASDLLFKADETGQEICVVKLDNDEEVGVMMGWERPIMEETVHCLCPDGGRQGLKVLNVGFGLGIIDSLFQSLPIPPSDHVIIEPHPDVLQHMKELGWLDRPGVRVLQGKWQDWINSDELLEYGGFDVIYTDTFSEDYSDLRRFFEHLPDLLSGPSALFGFFNGLGATNPLFYDVYTHVSELHLADVGIDVEWKDVDVSDGKDRWGKTRQYFSLPLYRLPVGRMGVLC
ncbi:arginine methyl transferase [Guyanagaster necrorhizus]|uniref:Arginine methyl transferase n=1 Tax=Guyanagaster necrorhizus TaxID=856835 RepID=A0A9P7VHW2_9AGAR|nr:arginine methyl transferase [Guyanagaster necrorhizus MCA 3950]KAG7440873.1 arginine methyl transferase [Guyanagaster necrorhizus MCA 3950]